MFWLKNCGAIIFSKTLFFEVASYSGLLKYAVNSSFVSNNSKRSLISAVTKSTVCVETAKSNNAAA